jgi:hypothetical protein
MRNVVTKRRQAVPVLLLLLLLLLLLVLVLVLLLLLLLCTLCMRNPYQLMNKR